MQVADAAAPAGTRDEQPVVEDASALKRRAQELKRERDSMLKLIEYKENAYKRLKEKHDAEEREKAKANQRNQAQRPRPAGRRPGNAQRKQITSPNNGKGAAGSPGASKGLQQQQEQTSQAKPKKSEDFQAKTIASLEGQLAIVERSRAKLKELLENLQDTEYVNSLNDFLVEKSKSVSTLEKEIAEMKKDIARLDKEMDQKPIIFSPLPSVEKAKDKYQVLDLQSRLYLRRDEYLRAYMGELGREFSFLSDYISDHMTAEDAEECMKVMKDHIASVSSENIEYQAGQYEDYNNAEDPHAYGSLNEHDSMSSPVPGSGQMPANAPEIVGKKEKSEDDIAHEGADAEAISPSAQTAEQKDVIEQEEFSDENIERSEKEYEGALGLEDSDETKAQKCEQRRGATEAGCDAGALSRDECAENFKEYIILLLKSFHDARKMYNVCNRLQGSVNEVNASLKEQVKLYEGPLADAEGDGILIKRAQEELRRLAERSEAIRKYAEEYQKYSGEIMHIE